MFVAFVIYTFNASLDEALIQQILKLFPDVGGISDTDGISLQSGYLTEAFIEAAKLELRFIGGKDILSSGDYRPLKMDLMGVQSLTDECFARLKEAKDVQNEKVGGAKDEKYPDLE